jgi:hypothetical protein
MSEASFESIAQELRAAAPPAPERLRSLVRTLPIAQPRLALRLRPALSAAIAIAIAVGLGAALIGGFTGSRDNTFGKNIANFDSDQAGHGAIAGPTRSPKALSSWRAAQDRAKGTSLLGQGFTPTLNPGSRLQQYDVSMNLRVHDLSRATQTAVRKTRGLGGYVAAANYSTGGNTGDSTLDLRVPVQHVQQAIASFTDLGTILSQRIAVEDLQGGLDGIDRRIEAKRRFIAKLGRNGMYTPAEVDQDVAARRALRRLLATRAALVRQGTYAKISLQLTTRKAAAKDVAPGRFSRFWGDAGDILGKEAIAVLYALVVAGPFAILAALALLGGRTRRRRADHRLLEETG